MTRKSKPAPSGDQPGGLVKSAQAKAQDDQVMATNNSSIVSKRSVENLYYPHEPPFFRYFVKKLLRRAPLINRGYWLRLRAIDVLCITRYPEDCENVKFVDVDFPDLIERKRQTVLGTPELLGMLTGVKEAGKGLVKPVVFESDKYVQIGCDLRDLKTLQQGLAAAVGDFAECEFIFVAEVSITYMETEGADGVIQWASTVGDAEFVLLEQILPDGEDHPFASTMLRHFEKLNTQLKSVRTYPTVTDQHTRFSARGWDAVKVWTLWETWADETFLSASERQQLDEIEQFDEWEEFALFGSHYCVVHARVGRNATAIPSPSVPAGSGVPVQPVALQFDPCSGVRGQRRFAAGMQLSEDGKQPLILNALGLGTKCRLQSCDVFSSEASDGESSLTFKEGGPTTRMCHTLTDLGKKCVLLAGGRESPSRPFNDCWLFGATCLPHGKEFIVMGGVARDHLLGYQDEVLVCSASQGSLTITRRLISQSSGDESTPRPLFAGHSALSMPNGSVVVVGGGATCFSMGTFWNCGVYTLRLPAGDDRESSVVASNPHWVHEKTIDIIPGQPIPPRAATLQNIDAKASITPIPRVKLEKADDFLKILRAGKPVVFEGLNMGSCVSAWTFDYLVDKAGKDRKVVIHEAATQVMDFTAKNFRYVTTQFSEFVERVAKGDRLYLRALSDEKPSEKPAVLADDFPRLAPDFVLPPQLSLVADNLFSSVLRLSGPVNMWLHYDVMANVYCQIGGSKRLLLFPPSDVEHLSFAPGASSSSIDVFSSLDSPQLASTHPHEAVLSAGEVLFLPPLWLHTATPTSDKSVAVNVFFKDLASAHYAAGRDVYGNRDLAAYEKGRQDIARIANSFKKLPAEVRGFYVLRLADELRGKARG
ncbi:tRNA methyltransferase ppm2 [Collariella sp. IMI 366227]|nr:tRNA methyltransferase ppm2 [Collariella sp. IMI 366227]